MACQPPQLGLTALRLPSSLEELGASPLFAAAASDGPPDAAELAAWLQQARQAVPAALDWSLPLRALQGGCLQAQQATSLVAALGRILEAAREQLEQLDAAAAGGRVSGGSGAGAAAAGGGDPRLATAQRNALKLSLFFLCCLAHGEGTAAASTPQPGAGVGGRKGKAAGGAGSDAAAAALASLRARRDALLAIGAAEEAVHECRGLLPALPDLRAAARAARSAALHCLAHPPAAGGDRGTKELAEACTQAASGILARPLVAAEQRRAPAAAAQVLGDLLGLAAEPKQPAQVLTAAARVLARVMQQSRRAGAAAVAALTERIQLLAAATGGSARGSRDAQAAAAAAAVAGQQLDSCLQFAGLLAGASGTPLLQAALLACLPQLLPLLQHASASTRRLALDLCAALLPAAARLPQTASGGDGGSAAEAALAPVAPAQALTGALLSAAVSRLGDKDATLRAKALACLEKQGAVAAAHLGGDGGVELCAALRSRLCDKSLAVRKRAIALLAALLAPAAGLAPSAAARLADAVLPVASRLLGVRPDSVLRPGEEALQTLSQAVLRMAASGTSAASVPHLLQLAAGAREAAARRQLQAAALDLLLPPGSPAAGQGAGEALLCSVAGALQQCSQQQPAQLRQAVLAGIATGSGSMATAAAVGCAVRLCYKRLHAFSSGYTSPPTSHGQQPPASVAEAATAGFPTAASLGQLASTAEALFVLGPLSSADPATGLAELGLLVCSLRRLAGSGVSKPGSPAAAAGLLRCLTLAWQQLSPTCFPSSCAGAAADGQPSQAPHSAAAAGSAQATLMALHIVLLAPSCTPAVRRSALDAAFALPPGTHAPLRLLRALTAAAASGDAAAADAVLAPSGPARLQLDEEGGQLRLVALAGALPVADQPTSDAGSSQSAQPAEAGDAAAARRQLVQQRSLVALLDLLGGMAATYEQQRAQFLWRLQDGAGASAGQQQQHTSKAGRPLRPASEWWVGASSAYKDSGGGAEAQSASVAAAPAGDAPAAGVGDYMAAEDEAAKHAEAAQRFLDSLLAAADSPPACYLPLLERLAGGCGLDGGGEEGDTATPPEVQAATLRALGRLAVLSEPLSVRAVAAAQAGLAGGTAEVQLAAVAVLEAAISAFPNAFSDRLALIGQRMAPPCDSAQMTAAAAAAEAGAATHTDAAQQGQGQGERVARAAAAAYCRLLLLNKLKLQGQLGPVGCALVAGAAPVAALARHALRQLLGAAPPKERARLALALFHQTPLGRRTALAQALTDPAAGLLTEADRRSDMLVGQALQALLTAAVAGPGSGGPKAGAALAAAAALLRPMQPSAKVLSALGTQLQAGGSGSGGALLGKLPPMARQALQAFVSNHHAAAAGQQEEDGEPAAGEGGGGAKRKRGGGGKGASAALQQQLLGVLSGAVAGAGAGGRHGRPPRPPVAAATEGLSSAVPTASGWISSRPDSSSRGATAGAATVGRSTRGGGGASRRTSTAAAGGGRASVDDASEDGG